jgi:glycosyltransferase involved in cell wall biosynthesis
MKITVFTATFNRASLLPTLYSSLVQQTFLDFEWIIVDDGSVDNTEETVKRFIEEGKLNIQYLKQANKGKHFAINKGVSIASGKLFFIVDSDDKLPESSLESIIRYHTIYKKNQKYGGVAGRKSYFDGRYVGTQKNFGTKFTNAIKIRYKHKIEGDLAEVFLTSVLKEHPFPEIEGEKFCPEALVWNRIAQKYKLVYFSECIYFCEYNADGLTSKIVKIRMNSPIASMICYSELSSYKISRVQKLKANINFWRFSFNSNLSFIKKVKMIHPLFTIVGLPLGFCMFIKDKINHG